jgi:hypothetical protein
VTDPEPDDEQPDQDPHAGCYLPHLDSHGDYVDCDGRPL